MADPGTISECRCNLVGTKTSFQIAQGNLDDLRKYLEFGWQPFLQQEGIASDPSSLWDAEHLPYWTIIKAVFCKQTLCVYSPNYATSWNPLPHCYSALIAAIRAQSAENVELLLKLGANPDGYEISSFEAWQSLFLHFRTEVDLNKLWDDCTRDGDDCTRAEILADMPRQQTVRITEEEVEERPLLEFWAGVTRASLCDEYPNFGHPLVIAAGSGLVKIMDLLRATDADRSFWTAFPALEDLPEPPTPSSLALSSPIHAAISSASQGIEMLHYLLQAGFNPNVLPLGDVCTSITPLMATFLHCELWNETAYDILAKTHVSTSASAPHISLSVFYMSRQHIPYMLFSVSNRVFPLMLLVQRPQVIHSSI
ncbi:hypothetical protein N7520_000534 [Penicillium odoratum]|uniref:uncharacterized protein n=1 Tax=Penicillium odoratum TaxID=1167516 RepID=UPI00254667C4|nr:uncharacterized protein N7520_000534 [Penicillium odoratum]KAJ5777288.1 hypothetical protein N7520_000534 [Penicillium odoratum]